MEIATRKDGRGHLVEIRPQDVLGEYLIYPDGAIAVRLRTGWFKKEYVLDKDIIFLYCVNGALQS